MRNLGTKELEKLSGGIVDPGPGGYEKCRAQNIVNYLLGGGTGSAIGLLLQKGFFDCVF